MRLSEFHKKVIWFVVISVALCIGFFSYELDFKYIYPFIGVWVLRFLSILMLINWLVDLDFLIPDLVALRYKIIENGRDISVKYLTFKFIFIPCWKPINTELYKIKYQNIFGAELNVYSSSELTYNNIEEAILVIQKHKSEITEKRNNFFKVKKLVKKLHI